MTADLVRILILCLLSAVTVLYLRRTSPEQAFLCALAGGAVILFLAVRLILSTVEAFSGLFTQNNLQYFKIALKALGIAYLTGFVADTCRDFGQTAMASFAETGGRCAIFLVCLPLLSSLLQMAIRLTRL